MFRIGIEGYLSPPPNKSTKVSILDGNRGSICCNNLYLLPV